MYTWSGKCSGSSYEVILVLHTPTEATRLWRGANPEHPDFPLLVLLTWPQELELYLCICTNLLQPDMMIKWWWGLVRVIDQHCHLSIHEPRTMTIKWVGRLFCNGNFRTFKKKASCVGEHGIKNMNVTLKVSLLWWLILIMK